MQTLRRTATFVALAAFAPLVIFATLQAASSLREFRADEERDALSRAREAMSVIDGELMSDQGALSVLSKSPVIVAGDPQVGRQRAADVQAARPDWKNVVLTDIRTGTELWETASERAEPRPARPGVTEQLALLAEQRRGGIGGIIRTPDCACVTLHQVVEVDRVPRYLVTVERGVDDIQDAIIKRARPKETLAVVDRTGTLIARSMDPERRIGTPATQYVRDAVSRGGQGIYTGVTYEGLANRTAYVTSDLSGWSTHIAKPSLPLALLSVGSLGFTIVGALTALAFAGVFTWWTLRDLKQRRQQEKARIQSQKLEAIGHFAGSVAHDFNNLLMIMIGSFNRLKRNAQEPQELELIEHGLAAADRGAQLISQLLSFARAKPMELSCVDLRAQVGGVQRLIANSLGSGVALEVDIAAGAAHARTNGQQLELALLNLAVNARDAMPEGGAFTIATRTSREKGCIDLIVRDTGQGMSEEVAARAMEPFFTTKAEGKGTGLGLAQVHALAAQSGGSVRINTAPGKGCEFVLTLPACRPEDVGAGPDPAGATPPRDG